MMIKNSFTIAVLIICELLLLEESLVAAYSKVSMNTNGQARSSGSRDVSFTVSPVYIVTPKTTELRLGEAVDHPSTPVYSTLDQEAVAQLDKITGRQRVQERFHPPASFEHALAHSNVNKMQKKQPILGPITSFTGSSSNKDVVFTKPIVSMMYDYPSMNTDTNSKPSNKSPISSVLPIYSPLKTLNEYPKVPFDTESSDSSSEYENHKPSNFDINNPPKSINFPDHYDHPFENLPSYAQPDYPPHEEIIYDHFPEDHYHHHTRPPMTTEEPEMMDQRLNKRPYSYYFIGKKLWYVPLYFSIYFIIYIAALVLKSIARHKINFPVNLAAAAGVDNARSQDGPGWTDYVVRVLDAIEKYRNMS